MHVRSMDESSHTHRERDYIHWFRLKLSHFIFIHQVTLCHSGMVTSNVENFYDDALHLNDDWYASKNVVATTTKWHKTNPLRAFNFPNRFFFTVFFSSHLQYTFERGKKQFFSQMSSSVWSQFRFLLPNRNGSCNFINERCQSFVIMSSKQLSYLSQFPFFPMKTTGVEGRKKWEKRKSLKVFACLTTWNVFSTTEIIFIFVYFARDLVILLLTSAKCYCSAALSLNPNSRNRKIHIVFKWAYFDEWTASLSNWWTTR